MIICIFFLNGYKKRNKTPGNKNVKVVKKIEVLSVKCVKAVKG